MLKPADNYLKDKMLNLDVQDVEKWQTIEVRGMTKGDWWAPESFKSKSEIIGHICQWVDAVLQIKDE